MPAYGGIREIAPIVSTRQTNPLYGVSEEQIAQKRGNLPSYQKFEVKVAAQERYGTDVHKESADDTDDHNGVPRGDLNSHHKKFVENKDGITDSNHLRAVDFGEDLRQALDHAALVNRYEYPNEESSV